jgi:dTDP-4-dehydrorhamnose 3,5-epimerase
VIFRDTDLHGAKLINAQRHGDARGYFGRLYCVEEFRAQGLPHTFVQQNISVSTWRGTLQGLHYQIEPHAEAKLVRCIRGAIVDVIVDLRPDSPTFMQWADFTLTAENQTQLLVPEGFAHGFQTLADDTEVTYLVSHPHTPSAQRGIRWDDPMLAIEWPLPPSQISETDQNWPDFRPRG